MTEAISDHHPLISARTRRVLSRCRGLRWLCDQRADANGSDTSDAGTAAAGTTAASRDDDGDL
jgi:hypothetical protein